MSPEQKQAAEASMKEREKRKEFSSQIQTKIIPMEKFYDAEE